MRRRSSTQRSSTSPSAAEEADGNGAADQVERDLDELSAAKRERDEYLELAQRTRADFENYRKRVAKETSDALARGKAELARQLLPVIDNLERALQSGADPSAHEGLVAESSSCWRSFAAGSATPASRPSIRPARSSTRQQHEALSVQPAEGTESGVVLETVEKGYRLDGQVLRPARVVVSK